MKIVLTSRFFSICCILCLLFQTPVRSADSPQLKHLVESRLFAELEKLCDDSSHVAVTGYLKRSVALRLREEAKGVYTIFAKFPDHAEVVRLIVKFRRRRIHGMAITPILNYLQYIDSFKAMEVRDLKIVRGDATFHMASGRVWGARPFRRLVLFQGSGGFRVTPADPEERLTLELHSKGPRMDEAFTELVMLLDQDGMPGGMEMAARKEISSGAISGPHAKRLESFNRQFGIFIPEFNEYWYPRFSRTLNLGIFAGKDGRCYHYQYNPSFVPDTTLTEMPKSRYLLSYNRESGMKISLGAASRPRGLQMNLYVNPETRFISANSMMSLGDETDLVQFALNRELKIHAVHAPGKSGTNIYSPTGEGTHYLRGSGVSRVMVQFSGKLPPSRFDESPSGELDPSDPRRRWDPYIVWTRDDRFYPGSDRQDFQAVNTEVSVPFRYRCLMPGRLVGEWRNDGRRVLRFQTPASKGLALVCGDFIPRNRIEAPVPVQIYAASDMVVGRKIDLEAVKPAVSFLVEAFGTPTVPLFNLLLRRWHQFGGLSYQGLAVINVPGPGENLRGPGRRILLRNRPAVINDLRRDSLVHELAHQWWGGEVSWNSYQDTWITEGLAQFATLFFNRRQMSPRRFAAAVRRMKRWVLRHSPAGPPVYGLRIANLTGDVETMQSVVYNRSALAFAMLTEILGEDELFARLRHILESRRHTSLTSSRFISLVCRGDERLRRFFRGWIESRLLPRVSAVTRHNGSTAMVELRQDGEFVIPLTVKITTAEGIRNFPVVMDTRELKRNWRLESPVKEVEVSAAFAPVEID